MKETVQYGLATNETVWYQYQNLLTIYNPTHRWVILSMDNSTHKNSVEYHGEYYPFCSACREMPSKKETVRYSISTNETVRYSISTNETVRYSLSTNETVQYSISTNETVRYQYQFLLTASNRTHLWVILGIDNSTHDNSIEPHGERYPFCSACREMPLQALSE